MVSITGAGRQLVESVPPPLHDVFSECLTGLPVEAGFDDKLENNPV